PPPPPNPSPARETRPRPRQLGFPTEMVRIMAFSLNAGMAALAGIVFASQIGFIPNQTGTGLEMKAIAACVLGGISLLGGSGTV
ncbi:ABC transporter permease subunit, partial [Salmonella enterica]|uniref:ABC transporter permease subunit n=1 Tax=Salmonella enterica TaxID=28901 RepID=UPI003D2F964F